MKRRAGWTATMAIAMGISGVAQRPELEPVLTVCLTMSDGLVIDRSLKAAVLSEVNRVWRPSGVAVTERGESSSTCDRQIFVKSEHEAGPDEAGGKDAIAWVQFVAGRARQVVFMRVDHARRVIDAFSPGRRQPGLTHLLTAQLLGRSLAHELGHVLLNSMAHESSGLMRAHYGAEDVLRNRPSAYILTAEQRERLFALSRARASE